MTNRKHTARKQQSGSLVSLAIVLVFAAAPNLQATVLTMQPLLAQAAPSFPLPDKVAEGTTIKIDGSSSMEKINAALKQNFEQRFGNTQVQAANSSSEAALQALRESKIDLAAIGRPLSAAEKAEGLVAVPIARSKIAIIVGSKSPFQGTLTNEQFAGIVRGDITDWSQVDPNISGGVRLIDRPDTSETRKAFQVYPVFQQSPYEVGGDTIKVEQDSTAVIVSQLGADGVSYAIADQVMNKPGVRVLDMYGTLPSDPKYPFSQTFSYVYKGPEPSPAVKAFLGVATTPDNRPAIEQARVAAVMSAPGATLSGGVGTGENPATMAGKPEAANPPAGQQPASPSVEKPPAQASGGGEKDAAAKLNPAQPADGQIKAGSPTASPNAEGGNPQASDGDFFGGVFQGFQQLGETQIPIPGIEGGFPLSQLLWLLVPLLGIPLLLWMLRGGDESAAMGAVAGGDSRRNRIILTPRNCRDAYAYWEVGEQDKADLREQGGRTLALRLYDVTGINWQTDPPHSIRQFDLGEQERDRHLPITLDDRDYQVELGYVTADGEWLLLAESDVVHVPKCGPSGETQGWDGQSADADWDATVESPRTPVGAASGNVNLGAANLGQMNLPGANLAGGAVAGATAVTGAAMAALTGLAGDRSDTASDIHSDRRRPTDSGISDLSLLDQADPALQTASNPDADCRLILVPRDCRDVYAYWELSDAKQAELRRYGREPLRIRLCDVTDIDLDWQQPHSVRQFVCPPGATDVHLPIAVDNRDYLVELGYLNDDKRWVRMARSGHVHVPECTPEQEPAQKKTEFFPNPGRLSQQTGQRTGLVQGSDQMISGSTVLERDRISVPPIPDTDQTSRIVLVTRGASSVSAHWELSNGHKAAAKQQGGQRLALRLYDVTDIDMDIQPPHSIYQFELDETSQDRQLPVYASDRDYLVELGYVTQDGYWLRLARSHSVRVSSSEVRL
jgi:phosphate transport system substrate-binding protein